MVLNKFKNLIDFEKYLKYVFSETKNTSDSKSSETNNNAIGRMMCMSACVESKTFGHGSSINQKTLKVIVGCLTEIYLQNDFLQESVGAIIHKILLLIKD